jgi:hypothetical protein
VAAGVPGAPYDLPFTPTTVTFGKYPTLVLGESGTAFVTDGADADNGPQIVSFDVNSGSVHWNYLASTQSTLSLVASTAANGLTAKVTDSSGVDTVLRFDATGIATIDTWSGTGIDYFISDIWTGIGSSSALLAYLADPVDFSTAGWFSPKQQGTNKAVQTLQVDNFSSTGPNQSTINNVLQKIVTALQSNSSCSNWLQGPQLNGLTYVQQLLQTNSLVGHGTFDVSVAAFTGVLGSTGVPDGTALTVNDKSAFFLAGDGNGATYSSGVRNYPGGQLKAQATILIHETAHGIAAPGFQHDNGIPKAEKSNNKLVDKYCRSLIEGLQ